MPAPTPAPRPPTPQTPLGVKNGSQSVKVQLKPVGTEDDASVPIYEWTFSVGGSETEVELDHLPAGVYTVRAFPVASGRWLRTEGKLITDAPWSFAVPTGASKVTVYWDGVPGATIYRVRWGVQSGVYPNASGVLSGGVRRYTVDGLVSEQAYYVVVEAEYNGVFGASSEEDSAVPHAGAIPWDTEDPNQIIPAVLQVIGYPPYADVEILSPDERYYLQENGVRQVTVPPAYYNMQESWVETSEGNVLVPSIPPDELPPLASGTCHPSGAYRQIVSAGSARAIGAKGQFWVPPPGDFYAGLYVDESDAVRNINAGGTRDAPHIYFGVAYRIGERNYDIEGGIFYMPARWGEYDSRPPHNEINPPGYERWMPYLRSNPGKYYRVPGRIPQVSDPTKPTNHIRYLGESARYGLIFEIVLMPEGKKKIATLKVTVWEGTEDGIGDPMFDKPFVVAAQNPDRSVPTDSVRVRRTVSIAQKNVRSEGGYRRTGSYLGLLSNSFSHVPVGIGHVPIGTGVNLEPVQLLRYDLSWHLWTSQWSSKTLSCPPTGGIVGFDHFQQWYRGHEWIDLRRRR